MMRIRNGYKQIIIKFAYDLERKIDVVSFVPSTLLLILDLYACHSKEFKMKVQLIILVHSVFLPQFRSKINKLVVNI